MILYEQNNGLSSNLSFTFDFGKSLTNLDCHSIALNDNEKYLLLIGNHELQFINFETFITSIVNTIGDDNSIIISSSSDIESVPLFDICNINRPIVQWNHQDTNQYALAVDRLVRFYNVDHGRIQGINTIIDTHHQRPISTISYWPHDPHCFLTGSLDGQVQIWDIRHCSSKTPANLKLTLSTPFSIRHIQWSSMDLHNTNPSNDSNQLAIQCDRCVRIYDMRRTDSYICSIEHNQRIISMDWTMQNHSIVTLSMDNSLRIFSTNGSLLAESIPNEQLPFALSKIRTTSYDNLFICASCDTISSTFGFTGWRWDEDQYLRPLTDHILSRSSSSIHDFTFVTDSKFLTLFNQIFSSRSNDDLIKHFPILAWCRDEQLRLIDLDSTFRKTWHDYTRTKQRNQSDLLNSTILSKSLSSSNLSRQKQQLNRNNTNKVTMDIIEDETLEADESDLDDNTFSDLLSPRINTIELLENGDEHDISITSNRPDNTITTTTTEVSIHNELNSLQDAYGPYIVVEIKDEEHRMCVLRCIYPFDSSGSFHIHLILSRHYPIISQLFVRFKLLTNNNNNNDERIKLFQIRIQTIFDETSNKCFYRGQLCLHKCLLRVKHLFDLYYKQEKISSTIITNKSNKKQFEELAHILDLDLSIVINNNINNKNSNRIFDQLPSPSMCMTNNLITNNSSIRANPRTCGARFTGGTYLICFGRTLNLQQQQQQQPTSAPPILNSVNDIFINRPHPVHMRSMSLTVTKSRGNSSTDEHSSSYRSSTTLTNTVQIQHVLNNQRTTIFSAPVRLSLGSSILADHQRMSTSATSYRRPLSHHLSPIHSTVSIYDMSILLPISKKLADDYKFNLNNLFDMCELNQQLTERMAKTDLTHCWRLLATLLALQQSLPNDHSWFETPIAQGLIKHLVSHYISNGDIQSASMFLLTMLNTPFMKTKAQVKLFNQHLYDPILYAYANLLHCWKHFYKRTQILYQIDYNCQSPASINQTSSTIICSICFQPVIGQHILCAICAHGGHLSHMHGWFSSSESKHRYCPEKDCACRCIIKQQELLNVNTDHIQKQQHTPILTPRAYGVRTSSTNTRPF
ncbi:unnamed protein product [Rotaria sp. Silwood1]|nr:unnamed protein product [Rotaria sp. Silwood1]CAF1133197.1 unnamed protein product [Rotaria sp. Silwood1]CAF3463262.1 unnamed protein product [Rotaria sp. Silwood1]